MKLVASFALGFATILPPPPVPGGSPADDVWWRVLGIVLVSLATVAIFLLIFRPLAPTTAEGVDEQRENEELARLAAQLTSETGADVAAVIPFRRRNGITAEPGSADEVSNAQRIRGDSETHVGAAARWEERAVDDIQVRDSMCSVLGVENAGCGVIAEPTGPASMPVVQIVEPRGDANFMATTEPVTKPGTHERHASLELVGVVVFEASSVVGIIGGENAIVPVREVLDDCRKYDRTAVVYAPDQCCQRKERPREAVPPPWVFFRTAA